MFSSLGRRAFVALLTVACLSSVRAQVSVTTDHNDLARTGQNTRETILTPANVNSSQFGKLFAVSVDGLVYAQPLYLWAVNIAGGTHNVLYIATEHDSIYAIDADSGTVYAQASLIPSGGSTVSSSSDLGCTDLTPEVGITGTPVIDPATATLYVVAKSKVNGTIVQYLHALSVTTLAEKFGGPVQIRASVAGHGADSSGGVVSFNAKQHNQRAALLLTNGHVLIAWSSHCDYSPWHGWLISYNASTLAQEAVFNAAPNDDGGGVWMSGAAPAADASGNIYFATGNGPWDGSSDFGDSIVKLGPPANGSFQVLDYFTPYDQAGLDTFDIDVASGGLVLLPPLASGRQLLAQQGKAGTIVLLDTGNLGKYCRNLTPACTQSDPQIVQELQGASPGIWGAPAYWNGNLYWTGSNDSIHAYSFNAGNSGLISTTPTSHSARIFAYSAPTPTVSSNGNTNGILWALDGSAPDSSCNNAASCLSLYAYDATNLASVLYNSTQAANNRDSPGSAVKFQKPVVANGKVYVGAVGAVTAYGLLPNSLPPGNAEVSLVSSANVDGIARDGSAVQAGGLDGGGYAYSATLLGTAVSWNGNSYAFGAAGRADAISNTTLALPAGNYTTLSWLGTAVHGSRPNQLFIVNYSDGTSTSFTQSVSDWSAPQNYAGETQVLKMPYVVTANGSLDYRTFYLYGYSFALNPAKTAVSLTLPATRNVIVLAVDLLAASTTPPAATPSFKPAPGTYPAAQSITLLDTTPGASIYYTTNGTAPVVNPTELYTAPIAAGSTTTIRALAVASGFTSSPIASGTYVISTSTTSTEVSLVSSANVDGIARDGSAVQAGGLDGGGYAYSATLLGTAVSWNGNSYAFGAAGRADAISNTTLALPAGNYTTLSWLGTAVHGSRPNQLFIVNYSDGTSTSFTQSVSDWYAPQNYTGETQVLKMSYVVTANGSLDYRTFYLYGYSFALNPAKTPVSLTLPVTRSVIVLAVDVH